MLHFIRSGSTKTHARFVPVDDDGEPIQTGRGADPIVIDDESGIKYYPNPLYGPKDTDVESFAVPLGLEDVERSAASSSGGSAASMVTDKDAVLEILAEKLHGVGPAKAQEMWDDNPATAIAVANQLR